jgi:TetR/AcrR family transcriptional repressor of nem operon
MARNKEFNTDAAIDSAMGLFWRRGYANTSLQELTEGLGINRSSLYGTFGSKHALFVTALTRYARQAPMPLLDVLSTQGPLVPRLRLVLVALVDADLRDPDHKGCMLINSAMETMPGDAETGRIFCQTWDTIHAAFESAIRRAQATGELPGSVKPAAAAAFLQTTLQGLRVMAKAKSDRQPLIASIDLALKVLN